LIIFKIREMPVISLLRMRVRNSKIRRVATCSG